MPNNGGTEEQPAEWIDAMIAVESAYNKVEKEDADERAKEDVKARELEARKETERPKQDEEDDVPQLKRIQQASQNRTRQKRRFVEGVGLVN